MSSRTSVGLLLLAATACRYHFDELPATDATTSPDAGRACTAHPCSEAGIYRSIGPGTTSALAVGAGNALTIAGTTATFALPLVDRIGLGDVIQYDATGDGSVDALAFVSERISPTEFLVAAQNAATPVSVSLDQDWAMFRAYTSLTEAAVGTPNATIAIAFDNWGSSHDLTAIGLPWHIACYGDATDTSNARFTNWITSDSAYLRIFTPVEAYEVGTSQRHDGRWDPTKYVLDPAPASSDLAVTVDDAFVRFEGLQIYLDSDNNPGDLPYGIDVSGISVPRVVYVSENIIRGHNLDTPLTSIPRGVKIHGAIPGSVLYLYNNMIYDIGELTVRGVEITGNGGTTAYLYNNTFVDIDPAFMGNDPTDLIIARNNVALECNGACLGGTSPFTGSNNVGVDFAARGIGVAPTTDLITDYFVADGDFHIDPTAAHANELIDRGGDLSSDPMLPFKRDIDRVMRVGMWDIGADEY